MLIKTATPLLAVLALGLGACGGGEATSAGGADTDSQSAEDSRVAFAQCLREQGIDVEDPGEGGGLLLRRGGGEGPERSLDDGGRFEEAAEKCREKLGDAAPPELSEEQREEFQDQALAFARCMREQGIDMPDPEFGEGGRFTQRMDRPADEKRFREAEEACKEFRPEPPGGPGGPGGARRGP